MNRRTSCSILLIMLTCCAVAHGQDNSAPRSETRGIRPTSVVERLARHIEPDLDGQPERLRQYIEFFRSEIGNDHRLFAFEVEAIQNDSGQVELQGHIEFPETRESLVEFLELLGFTVEDRLVKLPADELRNEIFGFVNTSHTLGYSKPSGRRSVETDCLLGEPLFLLRELNGHLLVHSGEGYLSYVSADDVVRVDAETFARYLQGPSVRMMSDHQASDDTKLLTGTRLKSIGSEGDTVKAELPTGKQIAIPKNTCEIYREPAEQLDTIIENAKQLLGTPYLWGGRTSKGIDCSGLVQIGYATAGLHLPRDSYQQFYVGRLSGTRWHTAAMRRGDTLYFLGSDGKIRHTGIYLGNDRYLHAVSPVVRINSFNPEHDEYDERRHKSFAFAKRLLE